MKQTGLVGLLRDTRMLLTLFLTDVVSGKIKVDIALSSGRLKC